MKFLLAAVTLLASIIVSFVPAKPVLSQPVTDTGCATLPSQARLIIKINLESEGIYRLWVRQVTPATGNQLYVDIDDRCTLSIAKNQQNDKLSWSGGDAQGQPLLFALDKGEHAIALAGDQTGIGVDKGLLTTDYDCVPQDNGGNCTETSEAAGEIVEFDNPASVPEEKQGVNRLSMALIAASIVGLLGVVGLVLRHYIAYIKRVVFTAIGPGTHWSRKLRHAVSLSTVRHFAGHHRFNLLLCGIVSGVFVVLLVVGIAVAQDNKALLFEAESGEVYGYAAKVSDPQASEGWYVLFGGSAPVITGSGPTPTPPTPNNNDDSGDSPGDGSGGGGGGGGGGGDGGGGGETPPPAPVGECPSYPAFPDENCTGWEHTGVTLENCDDRTDNGYIWDSNLTFDKCYFSKSLTVYGSNTTIKRSQIHGAISYHWSQNYSLNNLALIDVEIEQEGVEDINSAAVAGNNWSCLRCNVHHTLSGLHFGDNTTIRDSYTHDFQWRDEAHGAGIGTGQDHGSSSFIIHNNIQCNRVNGPPICSSALSIYPEDDNGDGITVHNVQVEKNLFNATGAYCVYAVSVPGSNVNFIGNYFGKKFYPECAGYGPVASYSSAGGQWVNNIWADGSGPVDPS